MVGRNSPIGLRGKRSYGRYKSRWPAENESIGGPTLPGGSLQELQLAQRDIQNRDHKINIRSGQAHGWFDAQHVAEEPALADQET